MNIEKLLEELVALGVSLGGRLLSALFVLVAGSILIGLIKKWLRKTSVLSKLDDSVRSFLVSFLSLILNVVLFITVAMTLGIPTTSFITALASCGVAVGLALQGSLSNFAGGLMILIFKPFRVGDFITTSGVSGTVRSISVVYTVLATGDNKLITIPNGSLMNSVVENASAEPLRRVDLVFNVNMDSDIDKVHTILTEAVEAHELILKDPEPFARLTGGNETSLQFTLRVWCRSENYFAVNLDLTESVRKRFSAEGINAPASRVDVSVDNGR